MRNFEIFGEENKMEKNVVTKNLNDATSETADLITEGAREVRSEVEEMTDKSAHAITDTALKVEDQLNEFTENTAEKITETAQSVQSDIRKAMKEPEPEKETVYVYVKDTDNDNSNRIQDSLNKIKRSMKSTSKNIVDKIKFDTVPAAQEIAKEFGEDVKSLTKEVTHKVKDLGERIENKIKRNQSNDLDD